MTGYRSGFAAGDPELIGALKAFRPTVGTAPQEFVQRASVVAWGDEEHVEQTRERTAASERSCSTSSSGRGSGSPAARRRCTSGSRSPSGETSEAFAERLLEHGILVAPGSYLGAAGEGYFRVALVPSEAECGRAVAILEEVL